MLMVSMVPMVFLISRFPSVMGGFVLRRFSEMEFEAWLCFWEGGGTLTNINLRSNIRESKIPHNWRKEK